MATSLLSFDHNPRFRTRNRGRILRWLLGTILLATPIGCGKQEVAQTASSNAVAVASPPMSAEDAEAVVSQFLDRIRRGGDHQDAMALLTDRAQSELQRIGQVVQPIGSPDAQFQVTRSTPMPVDPAAGESPVNGRLVHCIWTEPAEQDAAGNPTGAMQNYQVVWSVVMQGDQYRISGLILEMDPSQPPLVLDFENGDLMAQILGSAPAAQTAQSPGQTPSDPIR
ncbi:hypothetical protein [Neorhodopirellula pilleata]|uniref:Uncharacterized protein n=1 Tax=Neorhodopirellula pilleata TaxID=2714738 RepID=A0A5C5ZYV9_9BACT|nr:hypothetical protein [Neorhodopirellula pilleata]TWT92221.1 hypothetical protein Pla100_47580 [Neorhodopirellula pilleata]